MNILQLIASRNFIVLNKELIKILGLEEAILFGELCSEYDYWEKQDGLKDGYFFSTIENIENNTTLSDHKQRKALTNLKEKNIIDIKIMGIPAKRYIKINYEQVLEIFNSKFLKNLKTGYKKIEELELKKLNGNNNNNNNKEIKIINNISFDELWALYPRKIGRSIAYKAFLKAINEGVSTETIKNGILNYKKYIENENIKPEFIKHGSTWFNQKCWEDNYNFKNKIPNWYNDYKQEINQKKEIVKNETNLEELQEFFKSN